MFTLNTPTYFAPDETGGAPLEQEPVATETEATAEPTGEPKTFDEAYVKTLRDEAAGHRTKAKPFVDAFDGYEPEEVDVLLDLVRTIQSDPATAAARMEELVAALRETDEPVAPEGDKPLTKAEVEKLLADREATKNQDAAVKQIEAEAAGLGYTPNTPKYIELLWRAQNETNFDLKAAHEAITKERQSVIDDYVAGLEKQADGSHLPASGGGGASEADLKGDFKSARARLEARLNAVPGE